MKGRIKWIEEMTFVAESESGHALVLDAKPEVGGRDLGMRPMEMLLLGTAACSAMDVVHILKRGRHAVVDCSVEVDSERADTHPKVFTRIHMHFKVTGRDLKPEHVQRAIELSAETYCSASAMLAKTAEVTHDFEILEPAD